MNRTTTSLLNRGVLVLYALILLAGTAQASGLVFDYGWIENELKSGATNHVEFKQISDTPIVYRAWGVWNFAHPAGKVAQVALDFGHYPRVLRYVYRCDRVTEPKNRLSPLGTWYVEGRATIARVWAIGNIDTLCWTDSSHLRFLARQNEDKLLESKWNKQLHGWLNYRTRGVRIAAFIVSAGHDSSRVGVVAQGWVTEPMPKWLVRMATGIVLPQLLGDLDAEVARRAEGQNRNGLPWYKRWYRAVRRLFW